MHPASLFVKGSASAMSICPVNRRHAFALVGGAMACSLARPGQGRAQAVTQAPDGEPRPDDTVRVQGELPVIPVRTWADALGRPATQVMINGQGPFRFLADTGSNTTVLTHALAARLGLVATDQVDVLGVTGMVRSDSVRLASIRSGAAQRENMRVVLLGDEALAGLDGILGMDMFAARRLRFDFLANTVVIDEGARRRGAQVDLPVDLRHGLLVETAGSIGGIAARCVVDTGSQYSLVNQVLMDRLLNAASRRRFAEPAMVIAATSATAEGVWIRLPRLNALGMEVANMVAIGIDALVFNEWELAGTPTMLVGMDLLRGLKTLQIDYRRRRLQLELRNRPSRA
jgi:predicted aspartyl protease